MRPGRKAGYNIDAIGENTIARRTRSMSDVTTTNGLPCGTVHGELPSEDPKPHSPWSLSYPSIESLNVIFYARWVRLTGSSIICFDICHGLGFGATFCDCGESLAAFAPPMIRPPIASDHS